MEAVGELMMLMSFVCGGGDLDPTIAFLWTGVRAFRTLDERSPRWKRVCNAGVRSSTRRLSSAGAAAVKSSAGCASHEANRSIFPLLPLMCPIAGIQCTPLRNLNGIVPIAK
jgi:hypothetical protein